MNVLLIYTIYLGLGVLTGITSSVFGFGGGFIIVPALLWLVPEHNELNGLIMHIAIVTSLAVMIVNSLNATYKHYKNGNLVWRAVYNLAPFIAIGSLFGVFGLKFFSERFIKTFFILYLLYTILDCIVRKQFIHASTDKNMLEHTSVLIKLYGVGIGFIATVLGVGGSVMTVPLLRRWNAKMIQATATANPLSIPVAFIGSMGYFMFNKSYINLPNFFGLIYLPAFFGISIGGFFGVSIGSRISKFIPDKAFAKIYILLLIIVVIIMLMKG